MSLQEEEIHTGRCLCSAVRFHTRGRLREVLACHCSQCRRQTGLYYAATSVSNDRLTVEGSDGVTWYPATAQAERGFCSRCGSALFWRFQGEPDTSILAGAFDQPSGLAIACHVYCADKADFYEITDGLPQYPKGSPGLKVAEVE
ncbi:MAG: aldehyde-activating protein [Rhizobiales bacterium]|nr:aldehyde-activating protein [Hyphomicrobiales bacterium]MBA70152.1 aldehyde-activating protein [Hyphomicrobiales bacterium]